MTEQQRDPERPVYEGACPVCGWQMHRTAFWMVCSQPGCGRRGPLPVDQVNSDRRAAPLPGLE